MNVPRQLKDLIPPITFFVMAHILVLVAVADTIYVARLFQKGNLQKLWPVQILRFLVSGNPNAHPDLRHVHIMTDWHATSHCGKLALVRTFFTSILGWLLLPCDCGEMGNNLANLIDGNPHTSIRIAPSKCTNYHFY